MPKRAELWHTIETAQPDIIIGTETWLKPDITNSEIFPPEMGYNVFRRDRKDGYGGVLIATRDYLVVQEIHQQEIIEAVAVKITLNSYPLTVVAAYRTPTNSSQEGMNNILNYMDMLDRKGALWIGGDLNLPDIDWKSETVAGHQYASTISSTFIDKTRDLGLTQVVHKPTRNNKILDIFLTNRPSLITKCTTLPGLSDHDIVITESKIKACKVFQMPRAVTIWKKANIQAIKNETKDFSDYVSNQEFLNVENMWKEIHNHLNKMMKTHIPTKMSSKKYHQPWITTKLKRLARRKQRAWRKAKTTNLPEHKEKYELVKKQTRQENRKAYHTYMNNLIEDDSNKNLWKFIKSRKQDTTGTAPLIDQGITYSNDEDKANILNRQFCSVFTSENNNIPPTPVPNVKVPIMPDIVITERGVEKLLSELNPQKAAGPDRIPTRLLKMMSLEISPALTKLFQMSLNTGEIPKIWKHAIVQPIFKKGDRAAAQNYRPISLTCVCCKLLEHIIRSAITKHLESNKILNEAQHGFRKKRSCETQLITVIHDITSQLDKGGQTDLVLLDFAKAFDKVPHRRLINKLFSVGINQTALTWIESFLSGRSQEVVVGGKESSSEPVTSGVPQGSVLGPTLFLVYINDLPDNIRSKVCLFADDTILFKHIHSESDCEILQKDLDILKNWGEKWLMEFNVTKCHVMSITNKKTPFKFDYHLHNQKLEKVKSSKYLGVEISSDMKWSNHIAQIT